LKRDNKLIPYEAIANMEQSDNYFKFSKRFIFHADTKNLDKRKIDLFLAAIQQLKIPLYSFLLFKFGGKLSLYRSVYNRPTIKIPLMCMLTVCFLL
jgi:hypothetical protein